MPKTRVLVVDDSVVVRRIITEAIKPEPSCEIVGTAANGKIALAKLAQSGADVVTLDVEMPELDGFATLAEIRRTYPSLPVIMFSGLTERAAAATVKALEMGAADYVAKPVAASMDDAVVQVRASVVPKIRAIAARSAPPASRASIRGAPRSAPPRVALPRRGVVDVVAIGSSTGGPNALAATLAKLDAAFPVPIVVTQHMPPLFTRLLAERLDKTCALHVHEAVGGEPLEPGHVYLAPGDFHLAVRRDGTAVRAVLTQEPLENSCRPSVDAMIRSVVGVYGAGTLAVILTGMGQDGLRGCELVREAGGQVVAQDEASSVVWGMPGFVARAGLADAVVSLDVVHLEIIARATSPTRASAPASTGHAPSHHGH